MSTSNKNVTSSAYALIISSSDGAGTIGVQAAPVEYVYATSTPSPTMRGISINPGESLKVARALISGMSLYMIQRPAQLGTPSAVAAIYLDTDVFGS